KPSSWQLRPEAAETLTALKKQRLILDIVSNFDSRLVGIMEGLGAAPWFDHIFFSSHVGYAKPDREIFEFALNAHRLRAEEAIHVGDSKETDLQGAINAGLTGVLLDSRGKHQRDGHLQIQSLKELLFILHS
ncbi:MAG TPA: HAD-IA family hydrolase, partial [Candidatus Binatia bacterium]|nr:HAD-IA family hydrolase [Candidatus Binatia bacterium]